MRIYDRENKRVDLDQISPGPWQARKKFDQEELKELGQSIRENDVLQPISLFKKGPGRYAIIMGERRWRASCLEQLPDIPAQIFHDISEEEAAMLSLVENIQRKNLNPVEEAEGFKMLIEQYGFTHQAVADETGCGRTKITNMLRIIDQLPNSVLDLMRDEKFGAGHAKIILSAKNDQYEKLAMQIVKNGWSTRQLETKVKSLNKVVRPGDGIKNDIARLESQFSDHVLSKVSIDHNVTKESGSLTITYSSMPELVRILKMSQFEMK